MAHFLIADDVPKVRDSIRLLLEPQNHTCDEACDLIEIMEAVEESESEEGEPFDLILLDYDFGDGNTGFDAIHQLKEKFGAQFCDHRMVIITGHRNRELPREFARLGAIGHLIKPVEEDQFWATIDSALVRQDLYVYKKEDWESAYELLYNLGLIDGIESLKSTAQQYDALQDIYQKLLSDLQRAGGQQEQIGMAYESASDALNDSPGSLESIFNFLEGFGFTKSFLEDVKEVFKRDRLHFVLLQTYLNKIQDNPLDYRIKHLAPGATGHYEYRIGRSFRLYFRKAEEGQIVFERYGHKNLQQRIISYLDQSTEEAVLEKQEALALV